MIGQPYLRKNSPGTGEGLDALSSSAMGR